MGRKMRAEIWEGSRVWDFIKKHKGRYGEIHITQTDIYCIHLYDDGSFWINFSLDGQKKFGCRGVLGRVWDGQARLC